LRRRDITTHLEGVSVGRAGVLICPGSIDQRNDKPSLLGRQIIETYNPRLLTPPRAGSEPMLLALRCGRYQKATTFDRVDRNSGGPLRTAEDPVRGSGVSRGVQHAQASYVVPRSLPRRIAMRGAVCPTAQTYARHSGTRH
jgi:hypothetical protein